MPVNSCLVRDIVLQLSVSCCNNGGVINPENLKKHGVSQSKRERKQKREEASHYYRPGKLFEIVLSLSCTEISMVQKEGLF